VKRPGTVLEVEDKLAVVVTGSPSTRKGRNAAEDEVKGVKVETMARFSALEMVGAKLRECEGVLTTELLVDASVEEGVDARVDCTEGVATKNWEGDTLKYYISVHMHILRI
jgi:hypothetical protein